MIRKTPLGAAWLVAMGLVMLAIRLCTEEPQERYSYPKDAVDSASVKQKKDVKLK